MDLDTLDRVKNSQQWRPRVQRPKGHLEISTFSSLRIRQDGRHPEHRALVPSFNRWNAPAGGWASWIHCSKSCVAFDRNVARFLPVEVGIFPQSLKASARQARKAVQKAFGHIGYAQMSQITGARHYAAAHLVLESPFQSQGRPRAR